MYFFGETDIADIYDPITSNAPALKAKYDTIAPAPVAQTGEYLADSKKKSAYARSFPCAGDFSALFWKAIVAPLLNTLPNKMELEGIMLTRAAEDFTTFTKEHLMHACLILLVNTAVSHNFGVYSHDEAEI